MKRRYHVLAICLVILSFPVVYQLWAGSLNKTTIPTPPPPPPPPPPPRTEGGGSSGSSGSTGGDANETTPLGVHGLILNQTITDSFTMEFYFVAGTHVNGTIRLLSGAVGLTITPVGHNPVWGTSLGTYWRTASWNFTVSTYQHPAFYFPGDYIFQFSAAGSAYVIGSAT